MDFFDHQDRARSKSRRLVLSFVGAVAAIIVAVYAAVVLAFVGIKAQQGATAIPAFWDADLFLKVAIATLALVTLGSLYKLITLREGGEGIARRLGGTPIDPNTRVPEERRLLNVVEEMALAAGVPVPSVYLLRREKGINAFAAGLTPSDATIGVTAGCLELLSRDELQGVIAHEFSHILNGDMRLNLRLIALLHGILLLATIGYYVLRGSSWGGSSRRRGGGAGLLLFGLALLAIGYIGVFFGRLIKSGLSRQREFLADASAVQFTRNPSGLSGALKKIGGLGPGSRLGAATAEEASHLFFGNGVSKPLFAWLSTHPPLVTRIRAIEPSFDGVFPRVEASKKEADGGRPPREAKPVLDPVVVAAATAAGAMATASGGVGGLSHRVGRMDDQSLRLVRELRRDIPEALRQEARDPSGAVSVVYALLLDRERQVELRQLEYLRDHCEPSLYAHVLRQRDTLRGLGDDAERMRLPLVDLSIPALRHLSHTQYVEFSQSVRFLVDADQEVQLFEYTLRRLLERHLAPHFEKVEPSRVQFYSLARLGPEVSRLLSGLAHLSGEGRDQAFKAATQALSALGFTAELLAEKECGLDAMDAALRQLAQVSPRLKRVLIDAAAAAIVSDRRITVAEAELLRAVADALDCPMPPFLAA